MPSINLVSIFLSLLKDLSKVTVPRARRGPGGKILMTNLLVVIKLLIRHFQGIISNHLKLA